MTWTGSYWKVTVQADFQDGSFGRVELTYPADEPWDQALALGLKAAEQVIPDFPEGGKITVTIA